MAARYLLDTGVANLAASGHQPTLSQLEAAETFHVPDVVLRELYAGAYWYDHVYNSSKYLDRYDVFRREHQQALLACDADTTHYYAAIHAELRAKGQWIQSNDIWIAALARQHGLTLVTVDGDFGRIAGFDFERC